MPTNLDRRVWSLQTIKQELSVLMLRLVTKKEELDAHLVKLWGRGRFFKCQEKEAIINQTKLDTSLENTKV